MNIVLDRKAVFMAGKTRHILMELKGHLPFTAIGCLLGIVFMLTFRRAGISGSHSLFSFFHPLHVLLSAIVSSSMIQLHSIKRSFLMVLVIGFLSAVGTATLSDIVMPHIGARVLGLDIPGESQIHSAGHANETNGSLEHDIKGHHKMHLGFIEEWYLVNPAAIIGIIIGFLRPHTKFPHAGHILISTWATVSYLLMDIGSTMTISVALEVFSVLFLSVLIPCVISDIIFPLLFVRPDVDMAGPCPEHILHSHEHILKAKENKK